MSIFPCKRLIYKSLYYDLFRKAGKLWFDDPLQSAKLHQMPKTNTIIWCTFFGVCESNISQ